MNDSFPELQNASTFLLVQATKLWQKELKEALKGLNVTPSQFGILVNLLSLEKTKAHTSQVMLAHAVKSDVMTTSQVIRALEKKNLIKKGVHPEDPRAYYVQSTPKGVQITKEALSVAIKTKAKYMEPLGNREHELVLLLSKLITANETQ